MPQGSSNAGLLREWFCGCPALAEGSRFHVDYLPENATEYSLFAVPSEIAYRENVLGEDIPLDEQSVDWIFASKEFYGSDVEQNLANLGFYDEVTEWIIQQNAQRNFPTMIEGRVKSIKPMLTAYPVEPGSDVARYQIQIRIVYRRS